MNETRRESRIPRPANQETPSYARPLSEKPQNAPNSGGTASERKRRTAASVAANLDSIPESKRAAVTSGASCKPTRSAPPQSTATAAVSSGAFGSASEGAARPAGPAPGDETYEDIAARSGASVQDILSKKMQFKKGLKAEKKVEEMVPMIKELRAVGWYLHGNNERAELDGRQWKAHSEALEQDLASEREIWNKKEDELEQQMKDIQVLLGHAEENNTRLSKDLALAETMVQDKELGLQRLTGQLQEAEEKLARCSKELGEREAKIRGMEDVMQHSQSYSTTLQAYNTTLQADLNHEKAKREEVAAARDALQGQVAELTGRLRGFEERTQFDQDQVGKLREERDTSSRDLAVLRLDLDTTRQERDRLLADNGRIQAEYDRVRQLGGKSIETLETLTNDKATLEVQLSTQQKLIASMREELGLSKEQRAMAESLSESRGAQVLDLKAQVQQLAAALDSAERRVYEGEQIRRRLHNTIQELKGNIRVFCRVRPVSAAEQAAADADSASALALEFPESDDPLSAGVTLQAPGRDASSAPARHSFTFDKVFAPGTCQEGVFQEISELVQSALDGHKVCIFAYGQTGSGKTFTMLGNQEQPGMIPRAVRQIFESGVRLEKQGWKFSMQASMLEIYNEEYKDLLAKRPNKAAAQQWQGKEVQPTDAKKLQVVHNTDGSTTVTDLTVYDISQPERVEALLAEAMEKRSVGCTALNEQSSRSHMVFTMRLDGVNAGTGKRVAGVLNLIDLAGSERVKESGASGQRMKEAQAINTSLSALGDVIMALSNKQQHVPYRNSKLTYLLQPCLGGDAKTLMFVNVSPAPHFANESLCSLRFAAKVNACEVAAKKR